MILTNTDLLKHQAKADRGWRGTLNLQLAHVNGKTSPTKSYTTSPLRLQRPFYPAAAPANCQSVIVHTAGGMVGGDQLEMAIAAAPQTQALVTTAAAHKIYRSNGEWATQTIHLTVEQGAYLEWLPQELILFNGGRFKQSLQVELAPGGVWLSWDITRFGRSARGETLQSGHWRSATEVWQQGRPLWIDRQQLIGGSEVLTSQNGLAGNPVVGTFLLLGCELSPAHLTSLRELSTSANPRTAGEMGLTQLEQGLVARYRGPSSQTARQYFIQIWQWLRAHVLEQPIYVPR
ncbi:MAG: urease accessory protein UreD, partial [Cyanobacteria bacterium J06642_11]